MNYNEFVTQLIAQTSVLRAQAHMAHLFTTSFAKHMALNTFYEDVTDVMDKIVECSQGLDMPYNPADAIGGSVSFVFVDDTTIMTAMEAYEDFIESFIAFIDDEENASSEGTSENVEHCFIANILQEQQALITQTLYKLRRLS